MRRILLTLATLGIVCVAASQVQAHEPHGYHHGYGGYYGGYYAGYRAPIIVYPSVWARPTVGVPFPVYPPAVYPWTYSYPCYSPYNSYSGLYYQRPVLSIGIGF